MLRMRKRLGCCSRDREISIDLDEQERVMTYNGLESCILNSQSYENESRTSRDDGFHTESYEEDESISTSSSSSKDGFGSVSSKWVTVKKRDDKELWEIVGSPQHFYVKEKKPLYDDPILQNADVETMKEKFSKLLLGEDHSGGCKGISTALALSNAITSLSAMTFGELWKLEPLSEERKNRWRTEMGWLLSPTKYMVELVPAKQSGANGCTLEIMTPKARADIHMNLPALKKLDSMLIEMLDAMVNNEFWYAEGGSRAEGRSKRWWLPSPQVPSSGLSDSSRKKLMCQGRLVLQVLKAAKSINENMLLEMSVPTIIKNALPKSGRANLSDKLYKALAAESSSVEGIFNSLKLKSEHGALDCINKLEAAVLAWKEKISSDRTTSSSGKSPLWSPFMKDTLIELDKTETLLERAESLVRYLKYKYPNLPQTFLDVTKVKYGKDVGHAILEAYSRALANLAYRILSRIQDVLQEDVLCSPNSPAARSCCYPPLPSCPSSSSSNNCSYFVESPASSIRHSLTDKMNKVDGRDSCTTSTTSDSETTSANEVKMRSVVVVETPTVNCV